MIGRCVPAEFPHETRLFVYRGHPSVMVVTHADTAPPFFPPRHSGGHLFGRGACDAKESLAAQAVALDRQLRAGLLSRDEDYLEPKA
jgi:acetylornithine deacetylase/succinyl-diaminopimelate desuccinylase-like protein